MSNNNHHANNNNNLNITVLGAGVIGLTTALELQKQFGRSGNIEIIASRFAQDTTSHVAAGIFRPGTTFAGPSETITERWLTDSYDHWDSILRSEMAPQYGVSQISGYMFSSTGPELVRNYYLEKLVPLYRPVSPRELVEVCPGHGFKYGSFFTTLVVQCARYLPVAMLEFRQNGGRVTQGDLESLGDVFGDNRRVDLVINCTGLGSRFLRGVVDKKLVPIRGQVLKVKAPWLKTFFYADYDTYVIPTGDGSVTLGGCRQYDSYNLEADDFDSLAIKTRCQRLVPGLSKAELIEVKVGLRPHRDPVRVEREILNLSNGRRAKVVHNYGHGGYGVTSAPGTAKYCVELARELWMGNGKL